MHKRLKKKLWAAIDVQLRAALSLTTTDKSPRWRLYRSLREQRIFLRIQTHEVAGGGFSFYPGTSFGKYPTAADIPYAQTEALINARGFSYFGSGASVGLSAYCQVHLELDWQSPSEALMLKVLDTEEGRDLCRELGATATEKRHMLGFEIVESLGVDIPDDEFTPVVAKFIPLLDHTIETKIAPALAELGYLPTG